jgi:hypothetical protein
VAVEDARPKVFDHAAPALDLHDARYRAHQDDGRGERAGEAVTIDLHALHAIELQRGTRLATTSADAILAK